MAPREEHRLEVANGEFRQRGFLQPVNQRRNVGAESLRSVFSSRQHLNSVRRDNADVGNPSRIHLKKRPHERVEVCRCCGMNPEQYDTRLFKRRPALKGNLPEILIKRQHDARFGFGAFQN